MPRKKIFETKYTVGDFDPPAPILTIYLSPPLVKEDFKEIQGQIDTGADFTCVPEEFAKELHLRSIGYVNAKDFHHRSVRLKTYLAKLHIPSIFKDTIRVIGTNDQVALIGRDVLNQLHIELDGVNQILRIKL